MVALFTISNLLHFTLGAWMIDHNARFGNLLRNPMVIATFVGFACAIVHPPMPDWLMLAIKITGDAMVPLILISLGVRLAEVSWSSWRLGVTAGVVLWGVHMAMSQGLLAKTVADTAPDDLRGTAYGFFNLVSGLAMLVASAVAGFLCTSRCT